MNKYFFEITDTFGGEANYSWVRRYIVWANNHKHAMRKLNTVEGYGKTDVIFEYGDEIHRKPRGANVIIMGSELDPHMNVEGVRVLE